MEYFTSQNLPNKCSEGVIVDYRISEESINNRVCFLEINKEKVVDRLNYRLLFLIQKMIISEIFLTP